MPLNASRYALHTVAMVTCARIVLMMIAEYPLHRNNRAGILSRNHTEFIKTKRQALRR